MIKVAICIDDVNPKGGYGIFDTPVEVYLRDLYRDFGAKFTLFIPSNYHGEYPLSEHTEWVMKLRSTRYFELAAHGHYHYTSSPQIYGECEFAEIDTPFQCEERLGLLREEWEATGHVPVGWRNPGWVCNPTCTDPIGNMFSYVALHEQHNRGMSWPCQELYGHSGIHETEVTLQKDNVLMYQSHIAGDHNDNVWNQNNYEQLYLSLETLANEHEIEFITLRELME